MTILSRLPNLFHGPQRTASAQRLYEIFLARLTFAGSRDRVVSAAREIRRYANTMGGRRAGAFSYYWEMEVHEHHQDFESMWRSLRAQEKAWLGRQLRLSTHRSTYRDHPQLIFRYAPLLYLRGSYRLGCRLTEIALEMTSHRRGWSFEWLWHVYKPVKAPTATREVTLSHFYSALGRDLSQWEQWNKFLDGFDPKLFRTSGITKESLRDDSRRIKPFFEWIVGERRKRLFTGTTDGERDLTEPPSKVQSRQSARKRMLLKFDAASERDLFEQKLLQLFPELAGLPSVPSFKQLLRSRRS